MSKIVAVVGGGYSGVSIIANLARLTEKPLKVILFEKSSQVALGAAYSTTNPAHLLNVRANNMSAFPDMPNHFVDWLEQDAVAVQYLDRNKPTGQQFMPRCIYGRYLQSIWQQLLQDKNKMLDIQVVHEEVVDIHRAAADSWVIETAVSHQYEANAVVLATGNPAPNLFAENLVSDRVLNNPWQDGILRRIGQNDSVLIIGTGLTMVDMMMSLKSQQHCGKVTAIARRACLPQAHQLFEMHAVWDQERAFDLRTFTKVMRKKVADFKQVGRPWHSIVDSLRAYTQEVWQHFSLKDQKRFLRHVVPYWDTHRHRIAEDVAEVIQNYVMTGQLNIVAGRIQEIKLLDSDKIQINYLPRGKHQEQHIEVQWIINCTGPSSDYRKNSHPLFQSLLAQNLIAVDDLRLGLRTDNVGYLLDSQGLQVGQFFTLAALCKPLLWESIAVPDVRQQSFNVAKEILENF